MKPEAHFCPKEMLSFPFLLACYVSAARHGTLLSTRVRIALWRS